MELKQYQYILKVAELKNITKAAEELFITQPSLSHFIAKVEQELGTRIFNRSFVPLSLTPAGEVYVETARTILGLNYRMKELVRDISDSRKGVITIGMSHARASYFLPYAFENFKKAYPYVDICTLETKSCQVEEDVLKGRCDLGIIPLPCLNDELKHEKVFREELILVSGQPIKSSFGPSGHQYVDLKCVENDPFILLKKGHGIRTALDSLFIKQGVRVRNIMETTSNETAYRIATTGMALSVVPETTIFLSNHVKPPWFYSLAPEGVWWDIAVIYRNHQLLTQAQRCFIDLLKERFLNENYLNHNYFSMKTIINPALDEKGQNC